jgi:hypothetical protein
MDPYLEESDWVSVHVYLGVEIARYLSPLLRPKYYVRAEKVYMLSSASDDEFEYRRPDVSIRSSRTRSDKLGAATGLMEPPLHVALPMPKSIPQVTVEIRDREEKSLVTAIEILSLTNKRGTGREEYLVKRNRMLASGAHLMELDFLRQGARMPTVAPLPNDPYFVVLSRVERRPIADVWPIPLRSSLPAVPIPLSLGDPDVELDLQGIFTTLYDTYAYDLEINYDARLDLPLPVEDAAWAAERISQWRTRTV